MSHKCGFPDAETVIFGASKGRRASTRPELSFKMIPAPTYSNRPNSEASETKFSVRSKRRVPVMVAILLRALLNLTKVNGGERLAEEAKEDDSGDANEDGDVSPGVVMEMSSSCKSPTTTEQFCSWSTVLFRKRPPRQTLRSSYSSP